jgi:hypothetical protein
MVGTKSGCIIIVSFTGVAKPVRKLSRKKEPIAVFA